MMTAECRCGAVFVSFDGTDSCPCCNSTRDPLICADCGTRLREAVPDGLCGLCGGTVLSPVYAAALVALAGDLAA